MNDTNENGCNRSNNTVISITEEKTYTVKHNGREFTALVKNGEAEFHDHLKSQKNSKQHANLRINDYVKRIKKLEAEIEQEQETLKLLEKIEAAARGEIILTHL